MHRWARPLFALALITAAACTKDGSDDSGDPQAAFEHNTGSEWIVDTDPVYQTVSFAIPRSGPVALPSGDAKDAVLTLLDQNKKFFGLVDARTEWRFVMETGDETGGRHLRFQQYGANGTVLVDGGEWVFNVDAQGRLESIIGTYVPGVATANGTAAFAQADAQTKAANDAVTRLHLTAADVTAETDAAIFHADGTAPAVLAYDVYVTGPDTTERTIVDAQSGAILSTSSLRHKDLLDGGTGDGGVVSTPTGNDYGDNTAHGFPAGHYPPYNRDTAMRGFPVSAATGGTDRWSLSGRSAEGVPLKVVSDRSRATALVGTPKDNFTLVTQNCGGSPRSCSPKGVEVDSQATFAEVADQYKRTFNRNSFTGSGGEIVIRLGANGDGRTNAFFDPGRARCSGTFGVGDGEPDTLPLVASFDIIAHEFTHGVSNCTWGGGQSAEGAGVDEAMSDIMAMFLWGAKGAGTPTTNGHGVFTDGTDYGRNLGNPKDTAQHLGTACASMDEIKSQACYDSEGGHKFLDEHKSAAIVSYAWYLMTFGGEHVTNHERILCPMGWEKSQTLWSALELGELPRNPTFRSVANASIAAAQKRSMSLVPVVCAWKAMRVLTDAQVRSFNVDCAKGLSTDGGASDGGSSSDAGSADSGSTLITGGSPLLCEQPTSLVRQ